MGYHTCVLLVHLKITFFLLNLQNQLDADTQETLKISTSSTATKLLTLSTPRLALNPAP